MAASSSSSSSCSSPAPPAAPPATPPPPGACAPPPFRFRARHEPPDWRRLSAVEVERVAAEVDVAALQEHLEHVTFCDATRERCPHCRRPADPLLLRLLRLAQLCLEYLLHSQELLAARLRLADAQRLRLARRLARCRRKRRDRDRRDRRRQRRRQRVLLAAQQAALQAGAPRHQCQFCDKAFMSASFLLSHVQRRHSEEPVTVDQKKKLQTDKLQVEISRLKEQLQLTRSRLEAEQQGHIVKLSKEYEEHRSKEEEIRHLFHKWKEEEKEKLASELEKVKEMFMKEFKGLSAKNSELENHLLEVQKSNQHLKSNLGTLKDAAELTDEKHRIAMDHQNLMQLLEKQEAKWSSKVQALQEEHENEKHQLTSQIEKLKASVAEDLNMYNIFYKKRLEELGQKLQEQSDLIITQKNQIEKLASKNPVENSKLSEVKASVQNVRPKSSSSSVPDFGIEAENQSFLPAERLLSKEHPESAVQEIEKQVPQTGKNKSHMINTLKSDPSLTKELRTVLEQTLAEKLESLGIKSGVRGIPSDHLNRVLISVESAREERKKQLPDIQHIREQLERQVSFRVAERSSCSRFLSSPHLSSEAKHRTTRLGTSLPTVLPKPAKRRSVAKHSLTQRTLPAENTSTPKIKKNMLKDDISRKPPSSVTPPFSSEEEMEENSIRHSYISPELSLPKAPGGHSKDQLPGFADQSDINILEDEVDLKPSRSRSSLLLNEMDEMEKFLLSQRKESKQIRGINGGSASVQTCAQGVKFTGIEDEDDWDLSSLEDEKPLKDEKNKNVEKNDPCAVSMTREWGTLIKEEELQDAEISSSQKSSLVTVTDWSDSSDI